MTVMKLRTVVFQWTAGKFWPEINLAEEHDRVGIKSKPGIPQKSKRSPSSRISVAGGHVGDKNANERLMPRDLSQPVFTKRSLKSRKGPHQLLTHGCQLNNCDGLGEAESSRRVTKQASEYLLGPISVTKGKVNRGLRQCVLPRALTAMRSKMPQCSTSNAQFDDSQIALSDIVSKSGSPVYPQDLAGPSYTSTDDPFQDWLLVQRSWADMILANSNNLPEAELPHALSSTLDVPGSSGRGKKSLMRIRDFDWSQFSDDEVIDIFRPSHEDFHSQDSATDITDSSDFTDAPEYPEYSKDAIGGKGKAPEKSTVNKDNPLDNVSLSNEGATDQSHQRWDNDPMLWMTLKTEIAESHQLYLDHIKALEVQEQLIREYGEELWLEAEHARVRDCVVCGDSKEPLEFPAKAPTSSCFHPPKTCSECLQSWMASEFDSKGCDGIKCPECSEVLDYGDVQRAASVQTFEAYDKMSTRNALSNLPEFAWCLAVGCNSGQLNIQNNNYMDCASCGYRQCLVHKVPWHSDETCDQYDYRISGHQARDEEAKTEAMIDSVSKKCPGANCGWRIQKTDGCDHMTCRKCRHQFCWECLAAHVDIKRLGNTAHQSWCKFHSDQLSVAWPFNVHQ